MRFINLYSISWIPLRVIFLFILAIQIACKGSSTSSIEPHPAQTFDEYLANINKPGYKGSPIFDIRIVSNSSEQQFDLYFECDNWTINNVKKIAWSDPNLMYYKISDGVGMWGYIYGPPLCEFRKGRGPYYDLEFKRDRLEEIGDHAKALYSNMIDIKDAIAILKSQ